MENNGIDISMRTSAKVSREDIKKAFANDDRLEKLLTIFDKIDTLDKDVTGKLSVLDLAEMRGHKAPGHSFVVLDNSHDDEVSDWEMAEYFKNAKGFFGDDIELEDYRKFLGFVANNGTENYNKTVDDFVQKSGMSRDLVERLGGPEEAGAYKLVEKEGKQFWVKEDEDFSITRDANGNLVSTRDKDSSIIGYEGCEEVETYDENGEASTTYTNKETGEITKFEYSNDTTTKFHLKDGVATKEVFNSDNRKDSKLEEIMFNVGTKDATGVSFKYDENNNLVGIDVKDNSTEEANGYTVDGQVFLTNPPKRTKVDASTVEDLKKMLDGNARYGEDYDLKIEDGELKIVPKVINESGKDMPDMAGVALDRYKELVSKGIHQGEDFEVIYDENGNFRYNYKNNQAREYEASYKTEVYGKDGNLIYSLSVNGEDVVREDIVNGQKQTSKMKLDEALMTMALSKDFSTMGEILGDCDVLEGGVNLYPLADKYKSITGHELVEDAFDSEMNGGVRNLIAKLCPTKVSMPSSKAEVLEEYEQGRKELKEVLEFNPYNSQIADMLPKIQRVQTSPSKFSEKINNDTYDVNFAGGKIKIAKNNGKELSIDVSQFPEKYIENVLLKISSSALYDLAVTQTPLKLDDTINDDSLGTKIAGYYSLGSGISLDPNAKIGPGAIRTIVHESGHRCDHIDDVENAKKMIKEMMKDPFTNLGRSKPLTMEEALAEFGTLQPVTAVDDKFKEVFAEEYENYRKNRPNINSNLEYAITSPHEFFAEAYSLLNMGDCKSAYVIATFFPKSFARAKEIMEQNRASREV